MPLGVCKRFESMRLQEWRLSTAALDHPTEVCMNLQALGRGFRNLGGLSSVATMLRGPATVGSVSDIHQRETAARKLRQRLK